MDKIDIRYKNGKIYEITSSNTDMIYVGSCIITLKHRLYNHERRKDCSSKSIIECGDYNMNLIKYFSCNNKRELELEEQYWINKYRTDGKNVINQQNAYTIKKEYKKEYYINNREKNIEWQNNYHVNNREKNIERMREYNLFNSKKVCNSCFNFIEMLKHY